MPDGVECAETSLPKVVGSIWEAYSARLNVPGKTPSAVEIKPAPLTTEKVVSIGSAEESVVRLAKTFPLSFQPPVPEVKQLVAILVEDASCISENSFGATNP